MKGLRRIGGIWTARSDVSSTLAFVLSCRPHNSSSGRARAHDQSYLAGFLARQIGIDPDANPGVMYVFRMFGIRTVLLGAELLVQTGERREEALHRAVLIHASDTLAAFLATRSRQFPRKGRTIVAISALNTLLAVVANRPIR
jgi:hypothetical protein